MRSSPGSATRSPEGGSDPPPTTIEPPIQRRWRQMATWVSFAAIIVISTAVRIPMLNTVFAGRKAFRQSQTAFAIREFARNGIDLLNPPLPIFGPPWRVWLEFPLPQAVASLFVDAGMSSTTAGRLMGLLSLQVTALLLFLLVRRWATTRAALLAVVLYEAVPIAAWFGAASMIEFPATSLALAAVLALQRFLDRGRWWWWAAAAACSAGVFLVKVTTGTAWVPPLLALAVLAARPDWRVQWRRPLLGLLAAPGVGLVAEAWWGHYSNVHNGASRYTRFLEFRNDSPGIIGTIHDRFVWSKYEILMHRMGELMTGRAVLFLVAVVVVAVLARHRWLLLSLAVVPVLAAELWFPLYVQHDYYPTAVLPAVVAVMAVAIDLLASAGVRRVADASRWTGEAAVTGIAVLAAAGVLALSWTSGFGHQVRTDLTAKRTVPWESKVLLRRTPPDARIVTVGCSWDSRFLYNGDRYGLMYVPGTRYHGVLSAQDIQGTYQFVLTCAGPAALTQLPQSLSYERVGPGLYRIENP
jgi:hypothetical protein